MRDVEYESSKRLKILLVNEKGIKPIIFVKKQFNDTN